MPPIIPAGSIGSRFPNPAKPTAVEMKENQSLNTARLLGAAACACLPPTTTQLLGQQWSASDVPPCYHWRSISASADFSKVVIAGWCAPWPLFGAVCSSQDGGLTWTQTPASVSEPWTAVASSADGRKLIACSGAGPIITSDSFGTNWALSTAPSNYWSCVTCSANGIRLFAATWGFLVGPAFVPSDGLIYSSPDSGATWAATSAPSNNWSSIACSADGSLAVAAADSSGDGLIYISTNSGMTWTRSPAPSNPWASVASSADGAKLVAASQGSLSDGLIYISTNAGVAWRATSAPADSWLAAAASADGTTLVAYAPDGSVTSTNSGATWVPDEPVFSAGPAALALSADGNKVALALAFASAAPAVYTAPYLGSWRRTSAPLGGPWRAVASSGNGVNLVAAGDGSIYHSTNSGSTWTQASAPAPNGDWISIASSADGSRLAVVARAGLIYASTNAGATWAVTGAPASAWNSVASSADGTRLVAAAGYNIDHWTNSGPIYVSTNSGATWTMTSAPIAQWTWVASSADGTRLAALTVGGAIFTSPDSGASWAASRTPDQINIVALSADGTNLIAASCCQLYASTNFGATWLLTGAPGIGWSSLAASADGTTLVAAAELSGQIYVSRDLGTTWAATGAPAPVQGNWLPVVCSADGTTVMAAEAFGHIYTLRLPIPSTPRLPPEHRPVLSVAPFGSGLSWLVPSSPFVLEENSELTTTNWTDLTPSPVLNFTNLHYELKLSPSSARRFYRLRLR